MNTNIGWMVFVAAGGNYYWLVQRFTVLGSLNGHQYVGLGTQVRLLRYASDVSCVPFFIYDTLNLGFTSISF